MRRQAFTLVTLLLVAALGVACGPKRRPAVAAPPPPVAAGDEGARAGGPTPTDDGDDLRPLSDEGASGSDLGFSSGAAGEGGPLTDIRFDYDSAALSDQARAMLEKHALWLQNRREVRVTIEGHCDERGTVEYNLALGEQRARAARDYLISLGVSAERLSSVSYGKERPLDSGQGESAWSRNRRAHFAVRR